MAAYSARWRLTDRKAWTVLAARGALREDTSLKVVFDVVQRIGIVRLLVILGGPGLSASINLSQIVDTGLFMRRVARTDKIGNGDCGQEANERDDNHDFQ